MDTCWRKTGLSGSDYDARFSQLERAGHDMHGEANFVAAFDINSVLDAGCGTGGLRLNWHAEASMLWVSTATRACYAPLLKKHRSSSVT